MATVYNLRADEVPAPQVPGALLAFDDPPTTFPAHSTGDGLTADELNAAWARVENLGRGGAGAYAIDWDSDDPGFELTTTGALNVTVGAGLALMDGPVQIETPVSVTGIVDNATQYIWLKQDGSVAAVADPDLDPPTGGLIYLGRVVTAGGVVTEIDGSGVCYLKGPFLIRHTADTGCPSDTPPAGLALFTQCPGGLWLWDGERTHNLTNAGRAALTFASDADKTLSPAEYSNQFLDFLNSGAGTLTTTRDVILPLTPEGRSWDVRNNSQGGQSLRFIGASGTGITVATGKVARIGVDGTNVIRLTADL